MRGSIANDRLAKCTIALFIYFTGLNVISAQDYSSLREKMVREQIVNRGIKTPPVLRAMRRVERHLFVPAEHQPHAYDDNPLPIGEGQTISQPYVVAFMTDALQLDSSHVVLEVGTGSGYQAALLSLICREVYTIELVEKLALRSKQLLSELGYHNVHVKQGDGYLGWAEAAPFDAIIVTCSPSHVPLPLVAQIKEGGRMIIPVGDTSSQELILLTKKNGKMKRESRLPVIFVPMKNKKGERY